MGQNEMLKVGKLHLTGDESPTRAFCDLKILDSFVIKGLRVVCGKDGLFLSMPSEQGRDGKWYDTFFPLTAEIRKEMERLVLTRYAEELSSHGKK